MANALVSWLERLFRRAPGASDTTSATPSVRARTATPARAAAPAPARREPDNPYHAVSIAVGRDCCRQVEPLIGTRFLAKQAPKIPLPDCTASVCRCRYVHHADRRLEVDRRLRDLWKLGMVHSEDERRKGRGRRSTDE